MVTAGHALQDLGAATVIIKGGHGDNPDLVNDFVLLADGTAFWMSAPRIETVRTHGTGDTLSACITAELAKGQPMATAIQTAKAYVAGTIQDGIQVGHGHGPLNHWAALSEEVAIHDA